jgi:hypothetical protein
MNRLFKSAVRPFWRMTAPLRRPILQKIDARIHYMVAASIRTEVLPTIEASLASSARVLDRLEGSIGAANHTAHTMACDMDLMLGSVIREVARLQAQVDALDEAFGRAVSPGRAGLSLLESDDDGGPYARPAIERAKVG